MHGRISLAVTDESSRPAAAGRRLRALGRRPNRRLSQSFLTSPQIAAAMVGAAEISSDDLVLEIGPGLGILTRELVRQAGSVVCIELDPELAAALPGSLGAPANLRVVPGDATRVDVSDLVREPYLLVASLPYHVASQILFRFAFEAPRPLRMVVMLQEEVARRIVPTGGSMTFLSAALGGVAEARIVRRVPAGAFFPVPKVQSAIVRLDVRDRPAVDVDSPPRFVSFLRQGFTQPRRQLHNSLGQGLEREPGEARALLESVGVNPSQRPSELSLDEWSRIYRAAQQAGWLSAALAENA
ncbi:MAG: ribosomal RNA small subunit methyltransferase A [Chloroflexi bacterium]|nr:ribosomal RNA small subunit methyltransferase A [Chloroflexota bacterium]